MCTFAETTVKPVEALACGVQPRGQLRVELKAVNRINPAVPLGLLEFGRKRADGTDDILYSKVNPAISTVYTYELDTAALTVTRTGTVPADPTATSARATATESTVYLAVGNRVTPIARADLAPDEAWIAPDVVTGIEPSTDGTTLYVSLPDRVLALDPRTLRERRVLDVPTREPIDHVAPALAPIPDSSYVKCAC